MLSVTLRRIHMYLGLFFTPWVIVYALSTVAMNHRDHLRLLYGEGPPRYERLYERGYAAAFSADATPQQKGVQVLRDLGLDGAHNVPKPAPDGTITIQRLDPKTPLRIRYQPARQSVEVSRMVFETPAFLERMHRRRGFQYPYLADDVWAVLVDGFIVAMLFWFASGLWMWWEMRATRRLGALAIGAGALLFTLFLVRI